MLTVATLCGLRYEHFLPRWKGSVPIWAKKFVFTDDTEGIYEAKNKIVHECDTEYIWMVDVDDVINLKITKEDFEKLTEGKPDIIKLGNETGLWNYIFKTDFIKKCYDEIEEAKKEEGIDILDIVSCEDVIVPSTNSWQTASIIHFAANAVNHTVNDTSMTSSHNYNAVKLKSLYRNLGNIIRVTRHFYRDEDVKRVILLNCYIQYWNLYRPQCSDVKECDKLMFDLYGDLLKKVSQNY